MSKVTAEDFKPDKKDMYDTMGRTYTQSLFLECSYADSAVYTLKEEDHEYQGKIYPSLKKRYILMEDPTEYDFASKYLAGWRHWQKICQNKILRQHVEEWREELELKIAAQAYRDMVSLCSSENGNFAATKWLADKGWNKRAPGRPGKVEKERDRAILERVMGEFEDDATRLRAVQ